MFFLLGGNVLVLVLINYIYFELLCVVFKFVFLVNCKLGDLYGMVFIFIFFSNLFVWLLELLFIVISFIGILVFVIEYRKVRMVGMSFNFLL